MSRSNRSRVTTGFVFFGLFLVLTACSAAPEPGSADGEHGTTVDSRAAPALTTESFGPPECTKGTEPCYCEGTFCSCVVSQTECLFECKGRCQ
jgi:hypothetical protein